jgi:hypothetical protein
MAASSNYLVDCSSGNPSKNSNRIKRQRFDGKFDESKSDHKKTEFFAALTQQLCIEYRAFS